MIMQDTVTPQERLNAFEPNRPMSGAEKKLRRDLATALGLVESSVRLGHEIGQMDALLRHHIGAMVKFDRGAGV